MTFTKPLAKLIKKSALISYFMLICVNNYAAFIDDQLVYKNVKQAYNEKLEKITSSLALFNSKVSDFELMLKAYKYEELLSIYVRKKSTDEWFLYHRFPFCTTCGTLGPKVQEWDGQIPEGYYYINDFNPYSSFLLSLGVSYPNSADKLKRPAPRKGGGIYIHGGCATIGCIPIENGPIQELYLLAVLAKSNGQTQIPIHIFPFEYSETKMSIASGQFPEHIDFWKNLYSIEMNFDSTKIQRPIAIDKFGDYYLK